MRPPMTDSLTLDGFDLKILAALQEDGRLGNQELAERVQGYVRERLPEWKQRYEGVEELKLAVMGCVVNGPGESKHANIGISLPGSGETPVAPVFVDGVKTVTLKGDHIAEEFQAIVDQYVSDKYPAKNT